MAGELEIGVLLVDRTNEAQIGFIKFEPSGLLVYQIIEQGMHVFAFKPIDHLLNEQWIKEPLYEKHAASMDENKKLPIEILEQEARSCADSLNSLDHPPTLGGHAVKAMMVRSMQ